MPVSPQPDKPSFDPFRPQAEDRVDREGKEIQEAGEGEPAASEPAGERTSAAPPLGIRHLLLWMTFSSHQLNRLVLDEFQ